MRINFIQPAKRILRMFKVTRFLGGRSRPDKSERKPQRMRGSPTIIWKYIHMHEYVHSRLSIDKPVGQSGDPVGLEELSPSIYREAQSHR